MQVLVNDEAIVLPGRMSEDEFFEFCMLNRDKRIERTAEGDVIVLPPADSESGGRNADLSYQLTGWAKRDGRGIVFDSSTGLTLPSGAVLSPDAAWILRTRWSKLSRGDREKFAHICPDFVIELTSPTDRLSTVQVKMRQWISEGVKLGWLIDPPRRRVHVYSPAGVRVISGAESITGEDPVVGFVLDLRPIWDF